MISKQKHTPIPPPFGMNCFSLNNTHWGCSIEPHFNFFCLSISMAPTLTSNSFLLTPPPHSRLTLKNHPRFTVFAKKAGPFPPFRLGKPGSDSSLEESLAKDSSNSKPFFFDFGKLSDVKSLIPVVSIPSPGLSVSRRKDPGTVFVAGATGQTGIRIAQTLLREGFSVRAGVPELGAAQELARLAAKYKIISNEESKRINAVESTFQDPESIARAIGNASKVVVTIGPAENGPATEVSTSDALQVIQAAQLAGVSHVAIIYDGNTVSSSTYNVLDGIQLFFNNIFSKSQPLTITEFLEKVVETDVRYTLIKTSLTEDFSPESSYNVVVAAEGISSANDYKVGKLQIASLVADIFSNTAVAENKVVEVFTDPSAPSRKIDELFSSIPEDGRRQAYAEAIAKAKAEEEAVKAAEKAREAAEATKKLEEEVKKLSEQEAKAANLAEEAQEKAEAAGAASVESFFNKAKKINKATTLPSWEKISSQIANAIPNYKLPNGEKPKVQIATVRGQAKAKALVAKKAVVKPFAAEKGKDEKKIKGGRETGDQPKKEVRNVFGGLFKQEIIYIDDD